MQSYDNVTSLEMPYMKGYANLCKVMTLLGLKSPRLNSWISKCED